MLGGFLAFVSIAERTQGLEFDRPGVKCCLSYPFSSMAHYLHDLFSLVKRSRDQKFKDLISNVSFTN